MKSLLAAIANLSRHKKIIFVCAIGGFCVVLLLFGALTYRAYEYVQHDARFCQSCHIMAEPFKRWSASPHHMVTCHKCHQQPLSASVHQAWFYLTQRPSQVVHHPKLDHKVCAQCHLSDDAQWKLIGETAGHKIHFEKAGIECLDCHMGGVHEFLRPVEACKKCHAGKVGVAGQKMAFVHCTECHNFLGGKAQLTPDRSACLKCHQKIKMGQVTFPTDAPMSSFDCSTCHNPHEKIRPDREVCLGCHADAQPPHYGMKSKASCIGCHPPHSWGSQ